MKKHEPLNLCNISHTALDKCVEQQTRLKKKKKNPRQKNKNKSAMEKRNVS